MRKKPTCFIYIYGRVSSGKSPWAHFIEGRAIDLGFKVHVSDYEIFDYDPVNKNFGKKLDKIKSKIEKMNVDIGIIVIGTGTGNNVKDKKFRIEIEDGMLFPIPIMNIIAGNMPFSTWWKKE